MENLKALVLAGGSGTRLWPVSRKSYPKQLVKVFDEQSFLEKTLERLSPQLKREDIWIISNENLAKGSGYDIMKDYPLILEPVGRNTAAAIAVSAALFRARGEDPILLTLPSDHIIQNKELFFQAVKSAIEAANKGFLVTFGIVPSYPETGYGYIHYAEDMANGLSNHWNPELQKELKHKSCFPVNRFVEKPDFERASDYVKEGGYLWNAGIFVWKASAILDELNLYMPELYAHLLLLEKKFEEGEDINKVMRTYFSDFPEESIDYGVLEKSNRVAVVRSEFDWSDVGSWDAVYDLIEKDEAENAVIGNDHILLENEKTLIFGRERVIAASGLQNVYIIDSPDALLVMKKGEGQSVKKIFNELERRDARQIKDPLTVKRPWGSYTNIYYSLESYQVKRIEVQPGQSLSLQSHKKRSEHWIVVEGEAHIQIDDQIASYGRNSHIYIPLGAKHKVENQGAKPVVLVEVQIGDYLGEDDIIRYKDNYGRN